MNKKNVKRIIAMTLAIGTVSAVATGKNVKPLTTKAYASTYDDEDDEDYNDEYTFDSLELLDEDYDTVELYEDSDYEEEVDRDEVEEGTTYYSRTLSDTISIDISSDIDDEYIKVFYDNDGDTEGQDIDEDIDISEDTTITVRIYSEEPDSDVIYEDDENVIGQYRIKVEYSDDYDELTSTSTKNSTVKASQWVQLANGKWQYNDATGNPVKNTWVQNYYLQADGTRATGWLSYSGKWYYLGSDGTKKTGWQSVSGNRYYLDSQGIMQTGWIKDINGRYYYLGSNGAMFYNTTVGGYKLGVDGAWIGENTMNTKNTTNTVNNTMGEWKQDSTGWWYKKGNLYATGWTHIGNDWYYFYSDGYMAHDTKIGGYYVNSNGAWSTNVPASFSQGVRIGMTKEQVLKSNWGAPKDINKTTNRYGTHEQWVYDGYNYLYFEDGILTSIQN